ncbi:MAG: hypothetical protein ACE149_06865 [Armatimonadota bacterium]
MSHGPVMDGNGNFCEGASLADMNAQFEEEALRQPGLPDGRKVVVKLVGEDGNALSILGRVRQALRRAGMPQKAEEYLARATSGDYHHLLAVTLEYVVEPEEAEDELDEPEMERIRQAEAETEAWLCGGGR